MAGEHSITLQHRINFPFELRGGGVGVGVECNADGPSQAVAIPAIPGQAITVHNDGDCTLWFVLGGPLIQATTSCTPVPAGAKEVFSIPLEDGGVYTHFSAITRDGDAYATVNFGFGS